MMEFRKTLTQNEIEKGILRWEDAEDCLLRRIIPQTLVFDLVFEGQRLDHLTVEWEKRELYIGEPLMKAIAGSEVALSIAPEKGSDVLARLVDPSEKIMIRKRLSSNEHKHRFLKWYVREDDLYRRMFPDSEPFTIDLGGRQIQDQAPNFEKRNLIIGEAIRFFNPGDNLLLRWSPEAETPTLLISREEIQSSFANDAMTVLRGLVTRLISRPLKEFNEGEVKGLIVLLDENKNLWERLSRVNDENEKLKERISTLENVFEQFSRNSFFGCKHDFEEWVASHVNMLEKGIRLLNREYSITLPGDHDFRIDLLCQDRRGTLLAAEILFNPNAEDLLEALKVLEWAKHNLDSVAADISQGKLKANAIRGMIIANKERPELVEQCLQNSVKLCVVNSGCVIDVLE